MARNGSYGASQSLGIPQRTILAYASYQNKSVPEFVFNKIRGELEIGEVAYEEKRLEKVRVKSFADYLEAHPKSPSQASEASLAARKQKNGGNFKEEMKKVREGLAKRYGPDAHKKIGALSTPSQKKKYGEGYAKMISEATVKGLKRKHGEDWKRIRGQELTSRMKKKYGKNWGHKVAKIGWSTKVKQKGLASMLDQVADARKGLVKNYGGDPLKVIRSFSKYGKVIGPYLSRKDVYEALRELGKKYKERTPEILKAAAQAIQSAKQPEARDKKETAPLQDASAFVLSYFTKGGRDFCPNCIAGEIAESPEGGELVCKKCGQVAVEKRKIFEATLATWTIDREEFTEGLTKALARGF